MNWKKFIIGIVVCTLMLVCPSHVNAAYTRDLVPADRISATAGETLSVGDLVCIADADGYAYKADADLSTRRPAIGIVGKGATSGNSVEIVINGLFSGWSSLTEGSPGYISSTAGAITQTAVSSYSQVVAMAKSSTEYVIECQETTNNITTLGTITTDVTLDDGSGASPSLIYTDQNNQSATFSKTNDSYLTLTTLAADGLQILTGNLKVGNGTPTRPLDGEDAYIEGGLEVDGAIYLDNTTIIAGSTTLDDGSGSSPFFYFKDETNETAAFSKSDAGFLNLTTEADDGLQIITGNLKVGNRTPSVITLDGEDFTVEGDSELHGPSYFNNTVTIANTLTLDDGSGASPSLILTDETNESLTISKVDAGYTTFTTVAGDGVQITTGNLKVGNGTPGQTLDGEDFYCEGLSEFVGNVYLDDGSGASPSLTFIDATDETAVFSKADSGYLSVTTQAADGLQVLTGSLKVGNGTPVQTINGEDTYIEGDVEIAGVLYASGGIQYEGTDNAYETTIAFTDPTADRTITFPNYTGDVPVIISQDFTSHSANNTTTDGTSIAVPAGVLAVGTSLRFTLSGTCTGANAAKNVILYIDDAAIITLATAAADVGDWSCTFVLAEHTDLANQKCFGTLAMGDTIVHLTDYATDTTDFSGGITVKTQVVSGNAGDTIVQEIGIVEFLP